MNIPSKILQMTNDEISQLWHIFSQKVLEIIQHYKAIQEVDELFKRLLPPQTPTIISGLSDYLAYVQQLCHYEKKRDEYLATKQSHMNAINHVCAELIEQGNIPAYDINFVINNAVIKFPYRHSRGMLPVNICIQED